MDTQSGDLAGGICSGTRLGRWRRQESLVCSLLEHGALREQLICGTPNLPSHQLDGLANPIGEAFNLTDFNICRVSLTL